MNKILSNVKIYDLEESMVASGYAMRTKNDLHEITSKDKERCEILVKASRTNGAHAQFLTGIRVNFDVTFSNKAWVEAERYRFFEFVTSQSTMHRITSFDLDSQYNEYVDREIIEIMKGKIEAYNEVIEEIKNLKELKKKNPSDISIKESMEALNEVAKVLYLQILYSNPAGFKITARITTNYRCLLNMYNQRHNHRLPEWRQFCQELKEELPEFENFVNIYMEKGE